MLFPTSSVSTLELAFGAPLIWHIWHTEPEPSLERHKNYIGKWSAKWPMNKSEIGLPFEINLFEFYYL